MKVRSQRRAPLCDRRGKAANGDESWP